MPLAGFLPKVASAIKFQNFLPKVHPKVHRAHWDCIWANLVAVYKNIKTVITQELTVTATWNWHTRCPAYMCTVCQNFNSLTQMVQKLLPKVSIFCSFQDPWSFSFQDHCIVLLLGCSYMSYVWKGKYLYEISFQDLPSRPLYLFSGKTQTKHRFGSFQDPCFSLIPAQWQADSSCSNHQSLTGMLRTSN